jgi:conjugal transfer pilus assembly protein TraW
MRPGIVWMVASVFAALSTAAASTPAPARVTLGATYPIAEPDVRGEIRARAASIDWRAAIARDHTRDPAFDSADLPRATKPSVRVFDPTYVLPQDIRGADGRVMFPRGTRINVYERIRMPGRLIIIGPGARDLQWLQRVARPTTRDKVLLATGNVLQARRAGGARVFRLDARIIQRFGLRATPSIVEQAGTRLRITEHALP